MIKHDASRQLWVLEGKRTAYSFGLTGQGMIVHTYFGGKLPYLTDYPHPEPFAHYPHSSGGEVFQEEYAGWGQAKYTEPDLKAAFHDGVRDLKLTYASHVMEQQTLTMTLKDVHYPLEVRLHYTVHEEYDLITRSCEIANCGSEPVMLEHVLSGSLYMPASRDYRLTYLSGKWIGETQRDTVMLPSSKLVLESRRGITSHAANPFFMLDRDGRADEDSGEVYFGALAYSGNWKIVFEKDRLGMVKIGAGVNDFDFAWQLQGGASFAAPQLLFGYTADGFGDASRTLHRYQREQVLPEAGRSQLRKVLYNSWEATNFQVNEEQQLQLAKTAAKLGVELFVIDDGWFGQRNSDQAGLGDWFVNTEKFPQGMHRMVDQVRQLGMDFGLWVEPEMVNPDSDLYRAHPDWVFHFPTRERTTIRHQLVLNLAREDVRDYIFNCMDRLLTEYDIRFIKWDYNRNISEPGYPLAPLEQQREVWHRHAVGLYEIADRLKRKFPHVIFQSCSGGGGRVDLGALRYFDQVWTSDNTDAFDRLKIQDGFSSIYCAKIMEAWVTNEHHWANKRKLSLAYRFHSAMMGNLGIGVDLNRWSEDEQQEAKKWIQLYKTIRPVVQEGRQYRLLSPSAGPIASTMYVSEQRQEAVVFVFLHSNSYANALPKLRLRGLAPRKLYRVDGIEQHFSGEALMQMGIPILLKGDFQSSVIRVLAAD